MTELTVIFREADGEGGAADFLLKQILQCKQPRFLTNISFATEITLKYSPQQYSRKTRPKQMSRRSYEKMKPCLHDKLLTHAL